MEFVSSHHIFKPGILRITGIPSIPHIRTLGIFQASAILSTLHILMAGASKYLVAQTSSVGHFSFFSPIAISSIKSAGHFLFSIHASSVSMFVNFGFAHNKRQQADSAKAVTKFAGANLAPVLPRRCAGRYKSRRG